MIVILWNILLALFWSAISGEFNLTNLLVGLILGNLVLYIANGALDILWYFQKLRKFVVLIFIVFVELIKASVHISYDILTSKGEMRPGIIRIPLDVTSPAEITLFSHLISFTPGTLSLDLSREKRMLYVHVMYLPRVIKEVSPALKKKYESFIIELLR